MDVDLVLVEALLAEKREEQQPEHVERREPRAVRLRAARAQIGVRAVLRGFENFVLAEEAGEARRAGDRQRGR